MNIEQAESSIVTRLSSLVDGNSIQVMQMPESNEDMQRAFEDARLIIAYNGTKANDNESTFQINQKETQTFAVIIQANKTRGAKGVYSLFHASRKLLVGFSPTGCNQLTFKTFDLYSDENGVFTFLAMYDCSATVVENYEEPTVVKITQLNTNVTPVKELTIN